MPLPPKLPKPPTLDEVRRGRRPVRNIAAELEKQLSPLDRFAVELTERVGSIGFFLIIFSWTVLWLGWNSLAPKHLRFDPPMGFVLWLFISNVIQILLMPMILLGQNMQSRLSDLRAQSDYEVNLRAESEIEVILRHMEYQNELLLLTINRLGVREDELHGTLEQAARTVADAVRGVEKQCGPEEPAARG